MDVVVSSRVKCGIECTIQDIPTERFPKFNVSSLGATVNIGYTSVNCYSGGMRIHVESDCWRGD